MPPRFASDSSVLWEVLSPVQQGLLQATAAVARAAGGHAYLVGGPVRDLLLGTTELRDLDVMTTTDARIVATNFAQQSGGIVAKVTEFGTATVALTTDDGAMSLDFATTRIETYAHPGALPIAAFPAPSVRDDLQRRDFTINAMALPLMPDGFGALLDPFGGLHDLRSGYLRILHNQSFRDDPTRLFRGARYVARYRMVFAPQTASRAAEAVRSGNLRTISAARKRREIELGMRERDALQCLSVFDALGLLRATSSVLIWDDWVERRIALLIVAAHAVGATTLWPYWAAFAVRGGETAMHQLFADLAIRESDVQAPIRLLVRAFTTWQEGGITETTPFSVLARWFEKLPAWSIYPFFPSLTARLHAFYARLGAYDSVPHLNGNDLQRLGVPGGREVGRMKAMVRAAWLDERVTTPEDEKGFVENHVTK